MPTILSMTKSGDEVGKGEEWHKQEMNIMKQHNMVIYHVTFSIVEKHPD